MDTTQQQQQHMNCDCRSKLDERLLERIEGQERVLTLLAEQKTITDEAHKKLQAEHEDLEIQVDLLRAERDESERELAELYRNFPQSEKDRMKREVVMLQEQMKDWDKVRETWRTGYMKTEKRMEKLQKKRASPQKGMGIWAYVFALFVYPFALAVLMASSIALGVFAGWVK